MEIGIPTYISHDFAVKTRIVSIENNNQSWPVNQSDPSQSIEIPTVGARFAEASTAEEWCARGASMLSEHKNYVAAATCFRNAGDVVGWLSATAEARRTRAEAAASATERNKNFDGAARCHLMHAAAVAVPAHGGG